MKRLPSFLRRARQAQAESRRAQTALGSGYVAAAPNLSGTYVTPQTALGLTAVYRAITVISQDSATLPLNVCRWQADGGTKVDRDFWLADLLTSEPNPENSALKFRLDSMGHTLGYGNGYDEVARNPSTGEAEALWLLHPQKTIPKRRERTGRLFYLLDNEKELLPENVLHFAGMGFDGLQGYTPISIARQAIGLGMAAEQFGAALFGNGAIPKGVLSHPKRLGEAAANSLRRSWNQVHQGAQGAHQVAVLEEGMTWTNTQINPDDAQFLATRQFQVLEIARLYGVPPHKLGDYSQAHHTNVEESNLDYLSTTLAFWLTMLEAEYNRKLLTRRDRRKYVIRHDMSMLLRGNTQARGEWWQRLRTLGVVNADTIASRENLPLPGVANGGDKYLTQTQNIPVEMAGKLRAGRAAGRAF